MHHTLETPTCSIDVDEIADTLSILHPGNQVFEIRGVGLQKHGRRPETVAGYFSDPTKAADAIAEWGDYGSGGWFVTLQTIAPACHARKYDRLDVSYGKTDGALTTNGDVTRFAWLPLDFDPDRVSSVMADETERTTSIEYAQAVVANLTALGWPEPMVCDSGNGRHILYALDLPTSDDNNKLVKDVIEAVGAKHSSDTVKTDSSVANPGRVFRLYGTWNKKGDSVPAKGRVHRKASIVSRPDEFTIVTREQLRTLVDLWGQKPEPTAPARQTTAFTESWTEDKLESWITDNVRIDYSKTVERDRTVYKLSTCPTCDGHDASYDPCIVRYHDGKLGYSCRGARCNGLGWHELRERFDPKAARQSATNTATASTTSTKASTPEASNGATPSPLTRLRCVKACDVTIRPVEWLWPDRFALGKLNLLFGDPSCNKSTLTLAMAANVTHGADWIDGTQCCAAGDVVIVQAEDGASDTVVPRLLAAGADTDRVHLIDCAETVDGKTEWAFRLDLHVPLLDELLGTLPNARLVIIDPVMAFMGQCDSNASGDVRGLLAPLAALAERRNVCVVMVSHMSKAQSRGALQAVSGSHGFGAAVRAAWLVSRPPNATSEEQRIMVVAKNNLGRHRDGVSFAVESRNVQGAGSQPAIVWNPEPVTIRADDVVSPARKQTKQEEASEWLAGLGLESSPMRSSEVYRLGREAGYKDSTIQRAIRAADFDSWKGGLTEGWLIGRKASPSSQFDEWNNRD